MELVLFTRLSLKEQAQLAQRLSFLVKADVPLLECLRLIRRQTASVKKAKIYDGLIGDVEGGHYLHTSLAKHRQFGDLWVQLVRVGEASGILSQNLEYLAQELQKRQELRRKVLGALVYPIFITISTLGLVGLLTAYIFPKLMPIFTGLHANLPASTRALIAASAYLRVWGWLTLLLCLALCCAFALARRHHERVRKLSDRAWLALPIAGNVARAYNLAALCRTLGLLLRAGLSVPDAMEIAARSTTNRVYRAAYQRAALALPSGETLSRGLAREGGLFPDLLLHLTDIGESTGNLAGTLLYLSEMYEAEVGELTRNLSSAMEPALMILMGALVGFVAISVIEPIYGLTQHLSPK